MIDYVAIARRITLTLFAAQSLASAGFIAASTVSAIAGAQLSGQPTWAGVPAAMYLAGSALAAPIWGVTMDRLGRRAALALGLGAGVVGAIVAGLAVNGQILGVFLGGLVLMGAANAAVQLGRFVAAEVHPPPARGRAISNVVIGGTVGAVLGPLLVGPAGHWMHARGWDELSGAYLASAFLLLLGVVVVTTWLRPEPREVGRAIAELYPETGIDAKAARSLRQLMRVPGVVVAMGAMVFGQVTMVMLMVITSLHMKEHQHGLGDISLVIASHTFGMFAFSIISGRLADRYGRRPVIAVGAATLILACLAAPLSPAVLPIAVALFLLGLGWNFCYVGGSSLLSDQLSPAERARTQGFNDLLISLASATASLFSGVVFATVGYAAMGLLGAVVALIPLLMLLTLRRTTVVAAS